MQMVKYNIIASVRGEAPTHLRQKSLIIDSLANMGGGSESEMRQAAKSEM
jgi:hypothetical protein